MYSCFNNVAFMFEGPVKGIQLTLITCCSTPSFHTFPITQTSTIGIFAASFETMTREITVNPIESMGTFYNILVNQIKDLTLVSRVKSGIFGHTAKFRKPPCLYHS